MMGRVALLIALFAAKLASADDLPIAVSANAISGEPKLKVNQSPAGDQWQLDWKRDETERSLNIVFLRAKGNSSPRLALARDLHDKVFHEGLTEDKDAADVRVEDSGKSEIWGGRAQWVLGSELAERSPFSVDLPLGEISNKAPRGPERRFCVSFVWTRGAKEATAGAYCMVVPPGQRPEAEAMLRGLDLKIR